MSKILGFARDIILSYFYGASIISDVYLISLTIPAVILAIIGTGIYTGFVPMYTRIEGKDGTEKAHNYTNNVVNAVIVLCTIIVILGLLFTEHIVKLFATGFEGEALDLAVAFTRINLTGVYFTGLVYVFTSFLQTKGLFFIPAMIGLPSNFIVIVSFFISSQTNLYILPIGSLIATASQFILLILYGYKSNYRYQFKLEVKDSNIRRMTLLALPVIIGSSVSQINVLIDRTLASHLAVGAISALNYANTINLVVLGTIVSAIITVLYPKISKMCTENNIAEMKKYVLTGINAINLFVLPITVGYMIFAEPIIQLLFGRGEFDSQALSMTSSALFFYSIGLVGVSLREMLCNVFYSFQDTKTPMINASIAMLINIVLNFVLAKYLGIGGLALATSISVLFCSFLLFFQLRKRIGNFGMKTMSITFMKICIASLMMGGLSKWTYELLIDRAGLTFSLLLSVSLGIIVYFVMISFMKIKEVNTVLLEIKKRIKNISKINAAS